MTGADRRNENRAASWRAMPSIRPTVMVTPERDVPGTSASACAQPMIIASRRPMSVMFLALEA